MAYWIVIPPGLQRRGHDGQRRKKQDSEAASHGWMALNRPEEVASARAASTRAALTKPPTLP